MTRPADRGQRHDRPGPRGDARASRSKVLLLARSDASAWRAEEQAHSLCAKVDGATPRGQGDDRSAGDLADCDLVVEAVVEELEPKVELLKTVGDAAADADLGDARPPPCRSTSSALRAATPSASSACTPSTRW